MLPILLLLLWLLSAGFTWDHTPGDLTFKGYTGFTFTNFLTNVKGANPTDPYNFSDLRMANGPVIGMAAEWFQHDWLSWRLDGQYHLNAIKQQAYVACKIDDGCAPGVTKGWKGKALTIAPSLIFHSPAWSGLHLYAGGGLALVLSTLGDQFGNTESNDWELHTLAGVEYRMTDQIGAFAEYHHKEGYLECQDQEGCFRGRRYGNMMVFGISYRLDW